MSKLKISDLQDFDPAEHLETPEDIATYLNSMMEEGDPGMVAAALGDIARAKGMADIAQKTGITREALYKALREGSSPRLDTITRVCRALGVRLVAQPMEQAEHAE